MINHKHKGITGRRSFLCTVIVTVLHFLCRHRPVLEKCYDIDHIMKVMVIFRVSTNLIKPSSQRLTTFLHHYRRRPSENSTRGSPPECSATPPTTTTTTTPVRATGWSRCRCRCCAWTLPTMSSPRLTVSTPPPSRQPHRPLRSFSCGSWTFTSVPSLCSHSSGGGEAESQPGPAHHVSRGPHRFPRGPVAPTEHLHGPSLQAVCQGGLWTRQPTEGPLLIRELNKGASFSLFLFPLFILPSIIYAFHPL